jgi:hypothetical protein
MKNIKKLACAMLLVASGCAVVGPNQKWPVLPEYPRPRTPQVSRVELLDAIGEMPPGEQRERLRSLAVKVTDELIEAWRDFTFWGDRMNATVLEYNRQAEEHNRGVK